MKLIKKARQKILNTLQNIENDSSFDSSDLSAYNYELNKEKLYKKINKKYNLDMSFFKNYPEIKCANNEVIIINSSMVK